MNRRRGASALAFALVAPLFFVVALGVSDLIRVARAQLRAAAIAVQIGQIVSQCRTITNPGDRNNFWAHAERIAGSVINVNGTGAEQGTMVISAVARNTAGTANVLSWQMRTGNTANVSRLGSATGGAATVSDGFIVPANQTLMVMEVFARVRPWTLSAGLIGTALPATAYSTTLFLSRAPEPGTLQTAPANLATPDCTA